MVIRTKYYNNLIFSTILLALTVSNVPFYFFIFQLQISIKYTIRYSKFTSHLLDIKMAIPNMYCVQRSLLLIFFFLFLIRISCCRQSTLQHLHTRLEGWLRLCSTRSQYELNPTFHWPFVVKPQYLYNEITNIRTVVFKIEDIWIWNVTLNFGSQ